MRHSLFGLLLAVILVFAIGGTALAAPVAVGEEGQFFIFGDYAPWVLLHPFGFFEIGVGYTLSESIAFGLEYQFGPQGRADIEGAIGVFANFYFAPVLINAEIVSHDEEVLAKVALLYAFDLDPVMLALGGGAIVTDQELLYLLEFAGNLAMGEHLSIYGAVDYLTNYGWITYRIGMGLAF